MYYLSKLNVLFTITITITLPTGLIDHWITAVTDWLQPLQIGQPLHRMDWQASRRHRRHHLTITLSFVIAVIALSDVCHYDARR